MVRATSIRLAARPLAHRSARTHSSMLHRFQREKTTMRRRVLSAGLLIALGVGLFGAVGTSALAGTTKSGTHGPNQLVPLYEDNASDWATACSTVNGAQGGSYIIADVDAGLGAGP